MSTMSNGVVKKILESGREIDPSTGKNGPAFVQDWRNFLEKAQYRGEDITRAIISDAISGNSATICPYLRGSLGSAFGTNQIPNFNATNFRVSSLQPYKIRNQCTMPAGFNANLFRNDFSAGGGWATWNQLILPQNNIYGVLGDSLAELSTQRGFEEKTDQTEAGPKGYTSKRTGCSGSGANRQCAILGKIITPADLFGESAAETIDSEFGWLFSADEIQEALISLASFVISKLNNLADTGDISGSGTGEAPPPPIDGARQDCVEACIATYCQPQLPACIYETDPATLEQIPINSPCDPIDSGPRNACIANCQAQGCN